MTPVIIGVPALENHPPFEVLEEWWRSAINEGLRLHYGHAPPFQFRLVHWADLLYKYPLHRDENFSFDPLYDKQPYVPKHSSTATSSERGRTLVTALKEAVGIDTAAEAGFNRVRERLHTYWDAARTCHDRTGVQRPIREVLRGDAAQSILEQGTREILLVAHADGAVVAYDALRDLGQNEPTAAVECFLSLGSPLGFSDVKSRIRRERWDHDVRTPTVIAGTWLNLYDRRDSAVVNPNLRPAYRPSRQGIRVRDIAVDNLYQSDSGFAPGNVYGYLRTPEAAHVFRRFLSRDEELSGDAR